MPKFEVPTTAQVEQIYTVEAKDEEQAHARVRSFLKDPDMIGDGIVVRDDERTQNTSAEQVKKDAITLLAEKKPAALKDAAAV